MCIQSGCVAVLFRLSNLTFDLEQKLLPCFLIVATSFRQLPDFYVICNVGMLCIADPVWSRKSIIFDILLKKRNQFFKHDPGPNPTAQVGIVDGIVVKIWLNRHLAVPHGHLGMLLSRDVSESVCRFLRDGEFE